MTDICFVEAILWLYVKVRNMIFRQLKQINITHLAGEEVVGHKEGEMQGSKRSCPVQLKQWRSAGGCG